MDNNNERIITPEVILTEFGLLHNEVIDRTTLREESVIYCDDSVFITGMLNLKKSFYHRIVTNYVFRISNNNIILNTCLTMNDIITKEPGENLFERYNSRAHKIKYQDNEMGNLLKMLDRCNIAITPTRFKKDLVTEYIASYIGQRQISIFGSFIIAEKLEEIINQAIIDSSGEKWSEIRLGVIF